MMASGSKMSRREYEQWRDAHTWDPSRQTNLVVQSDLAPAAWIEPLLAPDSSQVQRIVPQGFAAYARIFFPFAGADIVEHDEVVDQEHVSWTEMARRNGRIAHALMEPETITAGPAGEADPWTTYGPLAPDQFDALLPMVILHTSSVSGWFLLWDGFGNLNRRVFNHDGPKVSHPGRDFYLLRGPLSAYEDFPEAPNYWWPDDRAWCVWTDMDFHWAYIAGSAACIEQVLSVPVIDALATRPEDPAHSGMDVINDPDGSARRSY